MFHGGGYWISMHGFWWVFRALIIGGAFFLFGRSRSHRDERLESPHEVLRRRLASGEITPKEYEERQALLDRDAGRAA